MRRHHLSGQRYIKGMYNSASPKDYPNTWIYKTKKMAVAAAIPDTSPKRVSERLEIIIANLTRIGNG